jgi:hypothetical protein
MGCQVVDVRERGSNMRAFPRTGDRPPTEEQALVVINPEQLSKIQLLVQQLDGTHPPQDVENRRHSPRLTMRVPLALILLSVPQPTPLPIYSRNLSVSGIGFIVRRFIEPRERIAVRLNFKGIAPTMILAQVTFCRYVKAGLYDAGAEFIEAVKESAAFRIPNHWMAPRLEKREQKTVAKPASTPKNPVPAETPGAGAAEPPSKVPVSDKAGT